MIEGKVQLIAQNPHLAGINITILREQHYFWDLKTFYKGQILYKQGQPCDTVYLIVAGQFEQFVNMAHDAEQDQ